MPQFTSVTPNLIVADISRSLAFYVDLLGFARTIAVPEQPPFVFVAVASGSIQIFLNLAADVLKEHPEFAGKVTPSYANSMFIETDDVDAVYDRLKSRAPVVMPIVTQWYGMREFSIADPDGYVVTFAQRVPA